MDDYVSILKEAVDIRDVVELFGVIPNGRGVCRCPFHDDRHPSAQIKNRRFHCYVCDLHIDIFEFVQNMTGCGFRESMKKINDVFRVVDLGKPADRTELSSLQKAREQKQREKAARNAAFDAKTTEHRRLWNTDRPHPEDDIAMGQYAAGLGRLEQLDYWFETRRYER